MRYSFHHCGILTSFHTKARYDAFSVVLTQDYMKADDISTVDSVAVKAFDPSLV